jgi:hypothetical protein
VDLHRRWRIELVALDPFGLPAFRALKQNPTAARSRLAPLATFDAGTGGIDHGFKRARHLSPFPGADVMQLCRRRTRTKGISAGRACIGGDAGLGFENELPVMAASVIPSLGHDGGGGVHLTHHQHGSDDQEADGCDDLAGEVPWIAGAGVHAASPSVALVPA